MPFKRISADEVKSKLEARKERLRDTAGGLAIVRAAKSPPSWDSEKRTARFVMSSESVDRYRDIVVQAGLDTTRFMENPQALLFHNSRSWPCGNWSDVTKILNGRPRRTEGVLNFMAEGMDPDCDRAAVHVAAGTIRTVSIGFRPDWDEVEMILDDDEQWTGGFRYVKSELLECSLVPIPAQPDALVKAADGDMVLAKELVEEILDTYAKSPEGLIIPRSAYEAAYMDVVGERSTFIVDKGLAPVSRQDPASDIKLNATTDEEAAALIGAKVAFDPENSLNKGWPFDVIDNTAGEVVASYIVQDGEHKGVHALFVEFMTDTYAGMFRGIRADRFHLIGVEDKAAETIEPTVAETTTDRVEGITFPVRIDASQAEHEIGRLSGLVERLGEKIAGAFRAISERPARVEERVEPTLATKELPSPEAIAAAKQRAGDVLARLQAEGRI